MEKICLNCSRKKDESKKFKIKNGYCNLCLPRIKRIEEIKKGKYPFDLIGYKYGDKDEKIFDLAKKDYIFQLENQLKIIKDSYAIVIDENIRYRSHRIRALKELMDEAALAFGQHSWGTLHEIDDYLDDRAIGYIYKLFSQILISKIRRLSINHARIKEIIHDFMKKR